MTKFYCEQYSPEWWELRRGIPTASSFDRILTSKTAKPSAAQEDYIAELLADRACQTPNFFTERSTNAAMEEGTRREPQSRLWYEQKYDVRVQQVGFLQTEDLRFGASPDGLVGEDGGIELKNPTLKQQAIYLMDTSRLLDDYRQQVHGSLVVSGLLWWDLCSYAPPLPAVKLRIERDAYTTRLAEELEAFWEKFVKYRDLIEGMI